MYRVPLVVGRPSCRWVRRPGNIIVQPEGGIDNDCDRLQHLQSPRPPTNLIRGNGAVVADVSHSASLVVHSLLVQRNINAVGGGVVVRATQIGQRLPLWRK